MQEEPQAEVAYSEAKGQAQLSRDAQTHVQQSATGQQQNNRQPQVNEQSKINEQYQPTIRQLPNQMIVTFNGGSIKLVKRKYCLKIQVIIQKHTDKQEKPKTIEELFPEKKEQTHIKVTIASRIMPRQIQSVFPNINELYRYLATCIGNEDKITVKQTGIEVKEQGKKVIIDFAQLKALEAARNTVQIELDKIEDKLLQFNQRQWQILESAADAYLNGREIALPNCNSTQNHKNGNEMLPETNQNLRNQNFEQSAQLNFVREYAHYVAELDEDEFLEEECQINEDEYDQNFIASLKAEQYCIKQFESKFEDLLKEYRKPNPVPPHPYPRTLNSQDRSAMQKSTPLRPTQGLPPGYTPPQVPKSAAADGLSSDQMLRLGNSNSKKEKLKLGKKMMKMGYSLQEVIQYIERLERQKKGEKKEVVFEAPSQGPVRPFHIPKTKNVERSVASQVNQANEKAVREMLIMLLREKRYKKLQDIKKHMESEGLVTTIDSLKKMIDEIRARNAQRKMQEKKP